MTMPSLGCDACTAGISHEVGRRSGRRRGGWRHAYHGHRASLEREGSSPARTGRHRRANPVVHELQVMPVVHALTCAGRGPTIAKATTSPG